MSTDAPSSAALMDALQSVVDEFSRDCDRWEEQLDGVVNEIDAIAVEQANSPLNNLIRQFKDENLVVLEKQNQIADEIDSLKSLLGKQSNSLLALIESASQPTPDDTQTDSGEGGEVARLQEVLKQLHGLQEG